MTKRLFLLLTIALLSASIILNAEVTLPAIFGDGMVLQQQTEAHIWGSANPSKTVTLGTSWDKQTYKTEADYDGHWRVEVKTPAAGGPYQITISDGKTLTLSDVLIGEVWICSGQSNMAMPMKGYFNQPTVGSNRAVTTSQNPNIRLFTVARNKSLTVDDDFDGNWQACIPENVLDFSAAAYHFGKMIQQALDVPVGLICSSWGGTRIEPWMSENGINKFDWVTAPDKSLGSDFSTQTPTVLFNAMIAPMVGYGIRGALWYQGEANKSEPAKYQKLMPGLIDNWRNEWGIGDFSFYYAQIAPFDYGPRGISSAYLREAQLKGSTATTNAGMACLMDIGEKTNIHPANKTIVGERLAYWALANTYGKKGVAYSGPVFKDMSVEGSVAKLTFDYAENGLTTFGKELTSFQVAGENEQFHPAMAFITREGVSVISDRVTNPVAVRYGFENFLIGELFNTQGLPASSFRTDDWEIK